MASIWKVAHKQPVARYEHRQIFSCPWGPFKNDVTNKAEWDGLELLTPGERGPGQRAKVYSLKDKDGPRKLPIWFDQICEWFFKSL